MICDTLISFAKQREKAFSFTGTLNGARAKAVTVIQQKANYWKGRNEVEALRQAEQQIREILPSPYGRFKKHREKSFHF
ncbi:hypothetical protein V8V91_08700 [Algoriphagus halophilus]|uniref:hypothetical protein n=1 Tax=Algoriphagus halophilus TaxID=226505 RepID=UPI00358F05F4